MTQASILAIGTELTQGQITNRNATWISERLTDFGIEVAMHLTVPDDHDRICAALNLLTSASELVIVTGGLGPTTDDFTRNVIADWSGAPLEFLPAAWEKIVRRLSERGIEVAPSNRIQCFFPQGATVLENLEGTADGFRFRTTKPGQAGTEVIVLPGPPREGQHLWDRFVGAHLAEIFPASAKSDLETWHCVGKSESSLGEIVEAAVSGFGVKTGYRASAPYVEVKIWIPNDLPTDRRLALLIKLESALTPYSVARNGEDLAARFAEALNTHTRGLLTHLYDLGTAGRLAERAHGMLRSEAGQDLRSRVEIRTRFPENPTLPKSPDGLDALPGHTPEWHFFAFSDGLIVVIGPHGKRERLLPNPYPHPALADRLAGYRAELALKTWTEMLEER